MRRGDVAGPQVQGKVLRSSSLTPKRPRRDLTLIAPGEAKCQNLESMSSKQFGGAQRRNGYALPLVPG